MITNSKNNSWKEKLLKRPVYIAILIGVLLLGTILYFNGNSNNELQPESINYKKTNNKLHITSTATTNGDYLKTCAPQVQCDQNAKYRNINGSCNNLEIPTWGASKTPLLRLMNANFSDGYYKLRLQTDGSNLPNARTLNIQLFLGREIYHVDENNEILMPFAQLIAHDTSGLVSDVLYDDQGNVFFCCNDEVKATLYPQCEIIVDISPDDPVYSQKNITCMEFIRSLTSRNYSCPLYPTTFINDNTHFIDASEVYGTNDTYAQHLRLMEGGQLNFTLGDHDQMFCPFKPNPYPLHSKFLYDTGNPENGNQNVGITAMQILFLRFHNYIAFKLSSYNSFWSDEIIYQEARRIVIGAIQRITYEDFLPIIIGKDFQELYGLNEENIYDPTVNPSISQELSSAALRSLHRIIPVQFNLMNKNYQIEDSIIVTDWMQKPDLFPIDNNFDKILKGFLETAGRVSQPSYNFYVSNFLFSNIFSANQSISENAGIDLLSSDIMRGRDVGLQPYNQVRNLCGLPLATNFENLVDLIHIKDIDTLKSMYHSVDDIDLIVGLLLEKLSDDALVGPTARCIIADGFYRFKAGDRFFYDVQGQPGSFTKDQLKAIKKITLGHVICATSDVDHVQQDIFKFVDHNLFPTSKLNCSYGYNIDLSDWKEYPNF